MIKVQFFITVIILFSFCAFSQETNNQDLPAKEWSLSFAIGSNFTLGGFNGSTISISKYISDNQEIRFSMSNNYLGNTRSRNNDNYWMDTLNSTTKIKDEGSNKSISMICQYQNHFKHRGAISGFFSVGPTFSYSSGNSDYNNTYNFVSNNLEKRSTKTENTSLSLGLLSSIGVEWDIHKSISIHAEYQLFTGYDWYESSTKQYSSNEYQPNINRRMSNEEKTKDSGWSINNPSVLFGLSVFF